ncbi:PepSY-like domain-containing protein [Campylobacter coli]|nr:PepSY-like domain-containing protein [Campylobacter coli]ELD5358423.1 PepSY-like domain-containing protein [Campylobacter coli]ELI8670937.1 PepSY-like domain-containing protein [Campylobacter coli]ELW4820097.1 PepSY-like domain-containing protein [Campylobacter coli]
MIISPDELPSISKEFLKNNFQAPIGIVQRDKHAYEVYLSDGTELEFESDGSWKEIESKVFPFDLNFLPPNLTNIIQNKFPNTKAREIERKINYYKIKLTNNIEVHIDFNGTILYTEYDD